MIGEKLSDRYELVSELGRGGMGIVYRAKDPVLDREVAVKVIAPDLLTPETEQRFQTEAQLVAKMDHPSIVSIHDFGRHEGHLFFVMPIIEGDSLRHFLKEGSLRLGQIVDINIAVAEALDYSHNRGVIHRDIKPENIMVNVNEDGQVRVKVMDFGLARGSNVTGLTRTGMLMGTMSYVSPEQVRGEDVGGQADLYSLGCVLYECVVGEVPFAGEIQAVLYRVVHEEPQSPTALGADIEAELDDIVLSCIAKDPAQRCQSAGDLVRSLGRYRSQMKDSQRLKSVEATRTMVSPRPVQSPFIGREVEFRELQQRLNTALSGECQFVVVAGEPGIGKSRLLDELDTLAAAREIRVLHGRFVDESGNFPYHGYCDVIQDYFRQKESGSASSGGPDFSELADDLISLFPMLAEVEAIRTASSGSGQIRQDSESRLLENRTQIFEILARSLTLLARGKPLILMLEDLHEAQVSVEALQYIIRRLGPTPTLIVGTYRPSEIDAGHPLTSMLEGFEGDRRFTQVTLGPFSPEEHREFLKTLTGGTEIVDELAQRLLETTDGNPFFTKEMVRSLLDAGSIAQDKTGAWSLSGGLDISSEALPATIQQAVTKRIAGLPDDLRRVLATASVMGRTFDFEDLEALVGDDIDVDEAADRFIQDGLLEEDRQSRGDRLTFSSAVVREVLYGGLPRRKRRTTHRRYAVQLEKRHTGRLDRIYPQLVHHYFEGDEPTKTVEFGLLLARKSLGAFGHEEAIRSSSTALEFLDEEWEGDPALEGEARMLLAQALQMSGQITEGLSEASAAIEIFEREGKADHLVTILLSAAKTAWHARQTEEARRWAEMGIENARALDNKEALVQFLSLAATAANLRGEYEKGSEYLREVEALSRGADEETEEREEIASGGRLVVALVNPVEVIGPESVRIVEDLEVVSNVFEPLLNTDEEGNLLSGLCQKWEILDQGRAVRLTLRENVRFQDGTPMTARDVKASFERAIRSLKQVLPPVFAAMKGAVEVAAGESVELTGVTIVSEDTLEVELTELLPIYPSLLTDARAAVAKETDTPSSAGTNLMGTGPFKVESRDQSSVTLAKDPNYWRGDPAKVDAIEFRTYDSAAAIASEFRAGKIDLARDLQPEDLETLLRDPRFRRGLVEAPQKITYFMLFNTSSSEKVKDEAVRKALSGVIRTRDLVWQTLGRFAQPATGLIPPGILGHDPGRRPTTISSRGGQRDVELGGRRRQAPAQGGDSSTDPESVSLSPGCPLCELGRVGRRGRLRGARHADLPGALSSRTRVSIS